MATLDYTSTQWADGEAGATPITADRLNNIENGVSDSTTQINTNTNLLTSHSNKLAKIDINSQYMQISFGYWGSSSLGCLISFHVSSTLYYELQLTSTKIQFVKYANNVATVLWTK